VKRFLILLLLLSCGKGINRAKDFPFNKGYVLVDHNGNKRSLREFKGKVLVVGYIYTHCPDICPLITDNMRKIYHLAVKEGILNKGVLFLSITFDPKRDKPEVLRDYMKVYEIDTVSAWLFLTGEKKTIDSLMKDLNIVVDFGPMQISESGDTTYFITHTDRIHAVGRDGKIKAYFKGSEAKAEEVLEIIKREI